MRATSKWRNEEILEHLLLRWTSERGEPVFTKYVPATPRQPDAAAAQAMSSNPKRETVSPQLHTLIPKP